ncbi:MFS transporter [Candidatus Uhrbacteria bacterium]|nr:MFS transporter [Candidatus Uhrbacteria bacterium]
MPKTYKQKIEANIWKYAVHLVTSKRIYYTITGVYLLQLEGATAQTVGLVMAVGSIASFLFELPSGYISDKIGHRNALILSRVFFTLSAVSYLIGGHVALFFLAQILSGIGQSLVSGTGSAFMHDTLRALKRDNKFSHIMGKLGSIGYAVPIVFIMTVPFLTQISFKIPFLIMIVLDLIGLAAAVSFTSPKKSNSEIEEIGTHNLRKVLKLGASMKLYRYILFVGFLLGAVTVFSGFKDVYQQFVGVPIIYYGIFWGLSRGVVALCLPLNGWVKDHLTFLQFLGTKLVLALSLFVTLSFTRNPVIIVAMFILIAALNWSFNTAEQHYLIDIMGRTSFKATLLSTRSLIYEIVFATGSLLVGMMIGVDHYAPAFLAATIVIATIGIPFYLGLVVADRRR